MYNFSTQRPYRCMSDNTAAACCYLPLRCFTLSYSCFPPERRRRARSEAGCRIQQLSVRRKPGGWISWAELTLWTSYSWPSPCGPNDLYRTDFKAKSSFPPPSFNCNRNVFDVPFFCFSTLLNPVAVYHLHFVWWQLELFQLFIFYNKEEICFSLISYWIFDVK